MLGVMYKGKLENVQRDRTTTCQRRTASGGR
jgi:hypothetical protein